MHYYFLTIRQNWTILLQNGYDDDERQTVRTVNNYKNIRMALRRVGEAGGKEDRWDSMWRDEAEGQEIAVERMATEVERRAKEWPLRPRGVWGSCLECSKIWLISWNRASWKLRSGRCGVSNLFGCLVTCLGHILRINFCNLFCD